MYRYVIFLGYRRRRRTESQQSFERSCRSFSRITSCLAIALFANFEYNFCWKKFNNYIPVAYRHFVAFLRKAKNVDTEILISIKNVIFYISLLKIIYNAFFLRFVDCCYLTKSECFKKKSFFSHFFFINHFSFNFYSGYCDLIFFCLSFFVNNLM